MKVSCDHYSQHMESQKNHVPNQQPENDRGGHPISIENQGAAHQTSLGSPGRQGNISCLIWLFDICFVWDGTILSAKKKVVILKIDRDFVGFTSV